MSPRFYGCAHRSPLKTGRLNGARRLVAARPLLLTLKGPKRGPAGVLGIPVGVCMRMCVCACVCVCVCVCVGGNMYSYSLGFIEQI